MIKVIGIALLTTTLLACQTGTIADTNIEPTTAKQGPVMEGPQEDVTAIIQVFSDWGEAREKGDVDGVVAVHHEDMLIMTRDKAIYKGHVGVRQFYADNYNTDSERKLFNEVMEVRALGDVGIVIGKFLVIDVSKQIEDPGYYLIVLKKNAANEWKIYRDIDTPSPDGLALKKSTTENNSD